MHGMPTAVQIAGRLVLFIRLAPDAQLVALGDDFALFGTKAGALHVQAGWRSGGAQSLARHRISVSRVFCLGKKAPLLERGPSVLLVWLRKRKPFRRPRSPFGPREYVHDMIRFTRVNGDAVSLPLAALPWRGRICGEDARLWTLANHRQRRGFVACKQLLGQMASACAIGARCVGRIGRHLLDAGGTELPNLRPV